MNESQLRAVQSVEGALLLLAGPGSGKTTVITHRIQYLISNLGVSPDKILVITFTKAAANEMESRFKYITKGQNYNVKFVSEIPYTLEKHFKQVLFDKKEAEKNVHP